MALIIRRRGDGSVVSEGDLNPEQVLTDAWLDRAVESGLATVTVTLNLTDNPVIYRLAGRRVVGSRKDYASGIYRREDAGE